MYAAMHRVGLANSPIAVDAADGLTLNHIRVAAAVRCAPPANAPTPAERSTCALIEKGLARIDKFCHGLVK